MILFHYLVSTRSGTYSLEKLLAIDCWNFPDSSSSSRLSRLVIASWIPGSPLFTSSSRSSSPLVIPARLRSGKNYLRFNFKLANVDHWHDTSLSLDFVSFFSWKCHTNIKNRDIIILKTTYSALYNVSLYFIVTLMCGCRFGDFTIASVRTWLWWGRFLVLVYFRFRQITDNNYWFKNRYKH